MVDFGSVAFGDLVRGCGSIVNSLYWLICFFCLASGVFVNSSSFMRIVKYLAI